MNRDGQDEQDHVVAGDDPILSTLCIPVKSSMRVSI